MDHRYVAIHTNKWWKSYDERKRTVTVDVSDYICDFEDEDNFEELMKLVEDGCVTLPLSFEVCGTCNGFGSHVNPDIDSHGITAEEWDRDWSYEDRDNYFSGLYDVTCYECNGNKVVPEIVSSYLSDSQKKILEIIDNQRSSLAQDARDRCKEIEMGY